MENIMSLLDPIEELTEQISPSAASDVIPSIRASTHLLKKTVGTDQGAKMLKAALLETVLAALFVVQFALSDWIFSLAFIAMAGQNILEPLLVDYDRFPVSLEEIPLTLNLSNCITSPQSKMTKRHSHIFHGGVSI